MTKKYAILLASWHFFSLAGVKLPNTSVVDVVGSDCSKGTGLAAVKEKLAIHTMGAIGDSYNDTPMLKAADISFTFSYAPEPVQQAAGHIVSSVREALSYL